MTSCHTREVGKVHRYNHSAVWLNTTGTKQIFQNFSQSWTLQQIEDIEIFSQNSYISLGFDN